MMTDKTVKLMLGVVWTVESIAVFEANVRIGTEDAKCSHDHLL